MLTRGVFHAVTSDDLKQLRRTKDGPARRRLVRDWFEQMPEEWRAETDKAWKFLFITLAFQAGPSGGNAEIGQGLGADLFYGKSLHRANFYVIGHVLADWLPFTADALDAIDENKFRELYFSHQVQDRFAHVCFQINHGIDPTEDRWREYAWSWLQKIRALLAKAKDDGRSLVFHADNC